MRRPLALGLLSAALLAGCISANVQSTFLADYDRRLDAVLLVTQFEVPGGPFETAIAEALSAELEARGVTVSARQIAADTAGPTAAEAAQAGATSVIVVRLGASKTTTTAPGYNNPAMGPGYGGASGMGQNSRTELSVALTDRDAWAVVWTADVVVKGAGSDMRSDARKAAQKLIETLDTDGLLPALQG